MRITYELNEPQNCSPCCPRRFHFVNLSGASLPPFHHTPAQHIISDIVCYFFLFARPTSKQSPSHSERRPGRPPEISGVPRLLWKPHCRPHLCLLIDNRSQERDTYVDPTLLLGFSRLFPGSEKVLIRGNPAFMYNAHSPTTALYYVEYIHLPLPLHDGPSFNPRLLAPPDVVLRPFQPVGMAMRIPLVLKTAAEADAEAEKYGAEVGQLSASIASLIRRLQEEKWKTSQHRGQQAPMEAKPGDGGFWADLNWFAFFGLEPELEALFQELVDKNACSEPTVG